ncbi:MAG: ABC transporter permease [Anaerolineales bacterium]|jgi:sodium transport system permease protein|nr:ABC transporter permease [Anaerolineales bacterium]
MLNRILIIFQKEVLDNLRDRRALTSTLMGTLLGPGLMLLLFFVLGRTIEEATQQALQLPIVGAEHAPNLVQFLEQNNVEILEAPANPEESVRVGDYDVILVISENYGENLQRGYPATVELIVDDSRQSSQVDVNRTEQLLDNYTQQLAVLRLVARGVSPVILQPLSVETVDVATPQSQAASLLGTMPYFLIFSVFLGGMHLAIDTTSGERERNSLEPLLSNPVARRDMVLGKMAATVLFTIISLVGTLAAFGVLFNVVPLEEFLGTRINIGVGVMLSIFLICLPMVGVAAAIQTIIAAFSRNYKEAQSYLSFLPLIPALPGMFLAFVPVKPTLWMMLIPTFGQQLIINQLMREEPVLLMNVVVSVVVTLVVAILLTVVSVALYKREQILFGR